MTSEEARQLPASIVKQEEKLSEALRHLGEAAKANAQAQEILIHVLRRATEAAEQGELVLEAKGPHVVES